MTAPLGSRTCPVLGCHRTVHQSASGNVYARCWGHLQQLLHGAFAEPVIDITPRLDSPSSARRPATPRAGTSDARRGVVSAPLPAA